jgi:DNA-binding transcriptional LysR family regulator
MLSSENSMDTFPWYATELFLRVCEAGGLSAASRFGKTGISQPALSAQMMTLEQHLGKKLFLRKPFELTAEGKLFLEEALRMRARKLYAWQFIRQTE